MWRRYAERSLRWFSAWGASVSWCGAEYSSPSLSVFDPGGGAASIYSAFSEMVGFAPDSELEEKCRELSGVELIRFSEFILAL